MPYAIGTVTDGGSPSKLAHQRMLETIKTEAEASGFWTTLRYDDTSTNHELILQGVGLTGLEEIFIGFQCYQNVGADYYNMRVAGFNGYNSGAAFGSQPGYGAVSVCSHNLSIDYWLSINAQRIILVQKVGTPIYETAYAGKIFSYGLPSQYPYALLVCGTLSDGSTLRYSDVTSSHSFGWKGNSDRMKLKTPTSWENVYALPWGKDPYWVLQQVGGGGTSATDKALRDTNSEYPLLPIDFHNNNETTYGAGQVWGTPDGVSFISGFSNSSESTLAIGSSPVENYVVFQDVFRTGFSDYVAIKLDD